MKTWAIRWISCLTLIALLNATSGTAFALHHLHLHCDHDAPTELPVSHDEHSCSICLFLGGTAGKYIVPPDTAPRLIPEPGICPIVAEQSRPDTGALRANICRGPPAAI